MTMTIGWFVFRLIMAGLIGYGLGLLTMKLLIMPKKKEREQLRVIRRLVYWYNDNHSNHIAY